jgi:hypothetical protein
MPANFAVVSTADDIIVACNYDPTGLVWCDMFDNHALAWAIDTTGASQPEPVVVGSLPPAPPDTSPVVSPTWVATVANGAIVADKWRGQLYDLFDWLASNNGATRKLRGNFGYVHTMNEWAYWAKDNPTKVWAGP